MTEYWKSQAKKFCDACKCWIADNKASVGFHENGKKHQLNVQQRLSEIRARGSAADRQAKKEETWLEKMEAAALKDYRNKDLGGGSDITARIFNEKKADREAEKKAIEEAAEKARERLAEGQQQQAGPSTSSAIGPQIPFPKPAGGGDNILRKMETPKSGTKWHRDAPANLTSSNDEDDAAAKGPKSWFEALTDEGHTYFWHVESHESRWDAPPEGFLSIAEQEEINARHEAKETRKIQTIYESQAIHGSHREEGEGEEQAVFGPGQRATPYGAWQTVESRPRVQTGSIDLQTPLPREAPKAPVTLHKDRQINFSERSTPSLGGANSFGGEIAFKKRKLNNDHRKNMRRKAENDD